MTDIEESESEFDLEHHGVKGMKWGQRKRYIKEGLLFGEEYHDTRKGKGRKGRGGGKGRGGSAKSAARKAERARKAAVRAAKAQERKTERARRKAERDAKRAVRDAMKRTKANRKMEIMRAKQEHQERMLRMKIEQEMRKQAQEAKNNQIQQKPQSSELSTPMSDHQRYLELSRKKVSQMSTNEINEWVNRTNAIQNYQRLTAEQAERNASAGKKIMNFVFDAGKEAAKEFAKQQIKSMVSNGLGNALKSAKSGNSAASNKAFQEVMKRARHARR